MLLPKAPRIVDIQVELILPPTHNPEPRVALADREAPLRAEECREPVKDSQDKPSGVAADSSNSPEESEDSA